jgi:hypothetical protein
MKTVFVAAIVILALCSSLVFALGQTENEKIQYLISSVEKLEGAKFTRNGTVHSGKEAASHLRMKLQKAGDKVKTAEDFIRLCASKSYVSGNPYTIRLADGKTIKAGVYFRDKLKKYNSGVK